MSDLAAEVAAIHKELEVLSWYAGMFTDTVSIKNELENIKWHHDLCKETIDIKKELDRIKKEYDLLLSQKKPAEAPKKVEEAPKKVEEAPKKAPEAPKKVEEAPKKDMSPESAEIEKKLTLFKEGKLGSKTLSLNNSQAHFLIPAFVDLLCEGLRADTKEVDTLELSNCGITTEAVKKIIEAAAASSTLRVLTLETNKIGPDGITFIGETLRANTTIKELRLTNQLQKTGTIAERAFVEALKANTTLVKCSLHIYDSSARNTLERILMHNANLARKANTATTTTTTVKSAPLLIP